jgi:hypothetical protein
MRVVGLLPALSIIAGAVCAPVVGNAAGLLLWLLPPLLVASAIAWRRGASRATVAGVILGFWACSVVLTATAADRALHPSLRRVLDQQVGGFDISTLGPEGDHDPILTRATLTEDASPRDGYVSLRVRVTALRMGVEWHRVHGDVTVSVGGSVPAERLLVWRAQRPRTERRYSAA